MDKERFREMSERNVQLFTSDEADSLIGVGLTNKVELPIEESSLTHITCVTPLTPESSSAEKFPRTRDEAWEWFKSMEAISPGSEGQITQRQLVILKYFDQSELENATEDLAIRRIFELRYGTSTDPTFDESFRYWRDVVTRLNLIIPCSLATGSR